MNSKASLSRNCTSACIHLVTCSEQKKQDVT